MSALTPMMKQFYEIKSNYTDCILFFRLGDFYEMFDQDAVKCSEILDITLTSREKKADSIPMCGVPYHSAENYIAKLNQSGLKVAICEQVSDPGLPGIVERKVIRVVTPSTNLSDTNLLNQANQFLVSINESDSLYSVCFADVSTGELIGGTNYSLSELQSIIATYSPKEIVAPLNLAESTEIYNLMKNLDITLLSSVKNVQKNIAYEFLCKHYNVTSLNSFAFGNDDGLINAIFYAITHIQTLLQNDSKNLKSFTLLESKDHFDLDRMTITNLEIFYTNKDFDKKNSLIGAIDKTATAMGHRLLRKRLLRPLKNLELINARLTLVEKFLNNLSARDILKTIYDTERILSKILLDIANPRDLVNLKNSINKIDELNSVIPSELQIAPITDCVNLIQETLIEEAPLSSRDAHLIKDGFNTEVDEYRSLLNNGKSNIALIQKTESEKSGIPGLKIGFNKVFGYYIEVSKGKTEKVPDYFIRKQTLTNAERYITPELKEFEEKVLSAESKLREIEEKLFVELLKKVKNFQNEITEFNSKISEIDVCSSLAFLATENNYSKPTLSNDKKIILKNGRHPVIENILNAGEFVTNDLNIESASFLKLLTGPNMGGKSTYLRQTAIIILLAQLGSFVPATEATIGVTDQIFSRVGASDNLAKGLSTFMVEMEETAYILKRSTENSFLILDEIGRGTSTIDGLSLAQAILEYIHNNLKARTLFATHYHELISTVNNLDYAENLCVKVEEDKNGKPVFLHKVVQGFVDKSYGIHVAEQAGIPVSIIERANELITTGTGVQMVSEPIQPHLFIEPSEYNLVKRQLDAIDINKLTPIEALIELQKLKESNNSA